MNPRFAESKYLMPTAIVIAMIVGTFFLFYIAFFGVQPGL
jgi:ABC-type multidrug transport system permease subunit